MQVNNRWQNKVILVVDDNSVNYQYIEALLTESGVCLIHAKTGEEAVTICQKMDTIDLVLMDIQLPFMSGYEATQKIKSFRKDLIIIALTAHSLNNDRIKSLDAGCDYYVTKPLEPDELFCIISRHLDI